MTELDSRPNNPDDVRFDVADLLAEMGPHLPGNGDEMKARAVDAAVDAYALMLELDAIEASNPSGVIFCIALAFMRYQSCKTNQESQNTSPERSPKTDGIFRLRSSWSSS